MIELKIRQAEQLVAKNNYDGWLITSSEGSDVHSRLLLQIKSYGRHFVLITPPRQPNYILATQMETTMIKDSLSTRDHGNDFDIEAFRNLSDLKEKLTNRLRTLGNLALNYNTNFLEEGSIEGTNILKYGEFHGLQRLLPKINFTSASKLIEELRSIKSEEEFRNHQEAVNISLEALENVVIPWIKVGITEKEIAAKLEYEIKKRNAEIAFPSIVASGSGSADPHHNTGSRKITEGALLIDFGGRVSGSCADITRTFWIGNSIPEKFEAAYEAVFQAKKKATEFISPEVEFRAVALKARETFRNLGYEDKKFFIHGLGHALGVEVHDIGPRLNEHAQPGTVMKENMLYTIEPGLYFSNEFGIRLEDDVRIGKTALPMSSAPKEIVTI